MQGGVCGLPNGPALGVSHERLCGSEDGSSVCVTQACPGWGGTRRSWCGYMTRKECGRDSREAVAGCDTRRCAMVTSEGVCATREGGCMTGERLGLCGEIHEGV